MAKPKIVFRKFSIGSTSSNNSSLRTPKNNRRRISVLGRESSMMRAIRSGMKHHASWTKTKTKTSEERMLMNISQHNDLSLKRLGTVKVGKQEKPKVQGIYRYRNQAQWVIVGTQGRQVTDFPECILTRAMLVGSTDATRSERYRVPDDFFTLNPYVTAPASTIYPGPVPVVPGNDVLNVRGVKTTFEILSMSKVAQVVKVYWLTPKFDTDVNPIDFWNQLVNKKNMTQGIAPFVNDIATASVAAGGATINDVNNTPFSHVEFNKAWKVVKKAMVVLQPGDQHNFSLNFQINSVISRITLTDLRKDMFMKGISVFPMVIVRAGLVKLEVNPDDTGEVSYAQPKIGIVHNQEITFGALPPSRLSTNRIHIGIAQNDFTNDKKIINDTDDVVMATLL